MQDSEIVELYFKRDENAIVQSQKKYGAYCMRIAQNILFNSSDSQECVNDTWLRAWNSIPPQRPSVLSAFFGRITRNVALNKYETAHAKKRGGEFALVLEELSECIADRSAEPQSALEFAELQRAINVFLGGLHSRERNIFLRRYWYAESLKEIAKRFSVSENNVKASLYRSRIKLKKYLERNGISI